MKRGIPDQMRIGIYVRESRDDNGEEYETIETQRDLLLDFVKKERLGQIAAVYIDDNVSGSVFERDGINLLQEDVKSGRLDMLLIKDLSRLGRNNAKTLLFLDFLEEYGVRVITYDRRYDSFKDNDTVGIETWYNERYVRDISRKIRANLRYKIEKGEYIGHPPFGYKKSESIHNRLEIDENQAGTVRYIYRLYREGYGYGAISKLLTQKGYPPPIKRWNSATVQRILTSRAYLGDTVQGVSERLSFKSKKARRLPPEKWVVTRQTHQSIVTEEEYEEVQRIRKLKKGSAGSHKMRIHPFSGVLFCGKCGAKFHARVRRGNTAYICGNYGKKGRSACSSHHISEKTLSEIVMSELYRIYEDANALSNAECLLSNRINRSGGRSSRIDKVSEMLDMKLRQQEILYCDRLEGRIGLSLFERMNASIDERIAALRKELEQLKSQPAEDADCNAMIGAAVDWVSRTGITREIVSQMVKSITVYDRHDAVKIDDMPVRQGPAVVIDFRI